MGWSRYLSVRGRIEWKANNLNKAAQTFKEMYHYCSQNKLHDRAVDAANMVAITGSSAEQIEWGKKGIAEAEAGSVGEWLGPLWNNLGAAYEDQEQYDSALQAYLKARDYHYQYGDEKNKMIADWAVGHAYRLNGRYDDAAKWLRPLPAWSEKLGDIEFQGWSWKELGQIEYHHGNYQLAAEYLLKARDFLLKAGIKTWDPKGYSDFIQLLEEVKRKSE